ncbi:hypothetical protein N2152v2_001436 [Parachlorella kessleri]
MSLGVPVGGSAEVTLKDFSSAKRKLIEQELKRRSKPNASSTLLYVGRWLALIIVLEVLRLTMTRQLSEKEAPEHQLARIVRANNIREPASVAVGGRKGAHSKDYFPKPSQGAHKQVLHMITAEELQQQHSSWTQWLHSKTHGRHHADLVADAQVAAQPKPAAAVTEPEEVPLERADLQPISNTAVSSKAQQEAEFNNELSEQELKELQQQSVQDLQKQQ